MEDIWLAVGVMSAICVACGSFTGLIAYSNTGQRTMLGLTLAVLGTVYFLFYASGQLFWARYVPLSAAIIYTNLASVLAALAAGWAFRLPKTPLWRRSLMSILMAGGALAAITWPLLSIAVRPPPEGGNHWQRGVAMQTSWATCSPAAAATLFRAHDIAVSEAEMIPLCLTDSSGTPTLGLYRGVKLIAQRYGRDVQIVNETLDELLASQDWPVLLAVELPFGTEDRRYAEQWGWIPGMGHSVVALSRLADGGLLIGDPSIGLEKWSPEDMQVLWQGKGMRVR